MSVSVNTLKLALGQGHTLLNLYKVSREWKLKKNLRKDVVEKNNVKAVDYQVASFQDQDSDISVGEVEEGNGGIEGVEEDSQDDGLVVDDVGNKVEGVVVDQRRIEEDLLLLYFLHLEHSAITRNNLLI
jgi:hypothetical protein